MSQDEQQPGGLLSKVVKFVRNPTINWSELDHSEDKESLYSKHVLKEMIERKRANDFIRRREFDQLRKLRQRGSVGLVGDSAASEASSFFDSSQPAPAEQREGTIKKIDAIEAQMAQQWPGHRAAPAPVPPAAAPAQPSAYEPTVHSDLPSAGERLTDFAATDILQPRDALHPTQASAPAHDMLPGVDWSFAAEDDAAFAHDPGLEEAAIRFANGDDAGAEAALLALVGTDSQAPMQDRAWAALFDLYRATAQHGRFDAMAIEFALRYHRSAPVWCSIPDLADPQAASDAAAPGASIAWSSPGVLDAAQVQALQADLDARQPDVLQLNWSQLATVQDDAAEPLAALFASWSSRKLQVRCTGSTRLESLVRSHTVSGQRGQSTAWWQLRMEWLRIARRPDEFDLVALDYCITYEVSPPSWEPARCTFVAEDVASGAQTGGGFLTRPAGESAFAASTLRTSPQGLGEPEAVAVGALSGVLVGDASEALAPFEARVQPNGLLLIACERMVRIDFAAAGSVLNWAAAQQAAGRQVQFQGLHRLVAIFFHVIGVSEHAKILPRRD